MPFRVSCPVEVRFRDCDAMGHVNHAVYFTYLEIGRLAYAKALGFRGKPDYIIGHAECDFLASAKTGDHLVVSLGVTGLGRTSFAMEYEITDSDGRVVATARTVQVVYDYGTKKPAPIPKEFREKIAAFEGIPDGNDADAHARKS
jgi:acyl-CoA thioester hydrolase